MPNTPRFTIRLSPEDRAAFRAAAARAHLELTAWMRTTLLREAALSEQQEIEASTGTKTPATKRKR